MEEWKGLTFLGFPNYSVSNEGTVKNFRGKTLKQSTDSGGYKRVTLCEKGKRKGFSVHRLVILAFTGAGRENETVDHIDRNKQNNKVQNLRWATGSLQNENKKEREPRSDCYKVEQWTKRGILVKTWGSIKEAVIEGGFEKTCIIFCCIGKTNSHKGFVWSYVEEDIEGEQWKSLSIEGFEIVVSNKGRVKRRRGPPTFGSEQKGYNRVFFCKSGGKKYEKTGFFIHRLVALAFIPNPADLPIVNHIDGNKKNNVVENLEWITYKGNSLHAHSNGLIDGKKLFKPVKRISADGEVVLYESIKKAAEENNTKSASICKVCAGKQKSTAGFSWSY